jgi:hypothetical protein
MGSLNKDPDLDADESRAIIHLFNVVVCSCLGSYLPSQIVCPDRKGASGALLLPSQVLETCALIR